MDKTASTIEEALRHGVSTLNYVSDAPDIDSAYLLAHAVGQKETSWLYSHTNDSLTSSARQLFQSYIKERTAGKPLAYILGSWEFYGREFFVTDDVLVPRPSTEDLVDAALKAIEQLYRKSGRKVVIADVGCGSGCIAVTLALESPFIETIYATDISPAALQVAANNVARYKLQNRIQLLEGDMLQPLASLSIDLIVSNPPYLPASELNELSRPAPRGVRGKFETLGLKFEPRIALDGGQDGQIYIDIIKSNKVPTIIETTDGRIEKLN